MTRLVLAMVAVVAMTGCGHTSISARNAPGDTPIETPPPDLRRRAVEPPSDPGEHVVFWDAGVLGGLDTHGQGSVSGETSLHVGWSPRSSGPSEGIIGDYLRQPDIANSFALNLGFTLADRDRPAHRTAYAELEFSKFLFFSLAGGWAWDPSRHLGGPQATATIGPLYLRSTTMLTSGTTFEVGLLFKLPLLAHIWSR